jgi:hypothetical protein
MRASCRAMRFSCSATCRTHISSSVSPALMASLHDAAGFRRNAHSHPTRRHGSSRCRPVKCFDENRRRHGRSDNYAIQVGGVGGAVAAKLAIVAAATRRQTTGRNVTRPRAADDFATIRARMEELRLERAELFADEKAHSVFGPRLHSRSVRNQTEDQPDRLLPRSFRRFVR